MKGGADPGNKGSAPEPGRWGRGWWGLDQVFSAERDERVRSIVSLRIVRYFTLPTATAPRLSSMATQAPEFLSDWRLR